ncbi:MAG: hypothetical protein Q7T80_00910 [Methanoregula sp.]|nr:hypothetical protein [Methanoregula sp.]
MRCSVCGTDNPDKNQFCNSCGKPLPKPQAGPVLKKEMSKTTWIIIGAILVLILIAAVFFLFNTPASSKAPVVGTWAVGDNWVRLNSDYSAKAYDAGSAMTVEGTWEELDPARYQLDWDTGGQDIMNYDAATQSLAPEGSPVRMTKTKSLPESTGTSATQAPVQTTCDPAAEELYFITESNAAVLNNPSNPRVITISSPVYVTRIMTYHYNSNKGAVPGTIGLKDESGKVFGPWQAVDDKGATGTASVHWSVKINQLVPAGKYTLIDSDPSTWSTNSEVGNAGVVWVYISKKCTTVTARNTPAPSVPAPSVKAPSGTPVQVAAGQVVHGTITTGTPVVAAQGSVPASGGTITVAKPGSPIDGLKFVAPAGAYPSGQQVTISSAPVTGNTFGSYFNPATPMIEINAGQAYADEPILVTIPVNIPDDQFAMAFYYDDATKKLEGVPTASQDSKSITIATRHFSNIIISLIEKGTLDGIKEADSGFRPGVDDWEFTNYGSVVAEGGHCAGQTLSMMWYYTEQQQRAGAPHLNALFDNNGRDKTPAFQRDNTAGYRFASMVQENINWTNFDSMNPVLKNVSDTNTFRLFKYSILLTGSPQQVVIYSNTGGHAIVCYRVKGNTLYIADPNYWGDERTIDLKGATLGPYSSGANANDIAEKGATSYPKIIYFAKSAMIPWPEIEALYKKFEDGTIGDDKFPKYSIIIGTIGNDGKEIYSLWIPGGKNSMPPPITVNNKSATFYTRSDDPIKLNRMVGYLYQDGKELPEYTLNLKEGSNMVAFEVKHKRTLPDGNLTYDWMGFDWLELNYVPATPTPTTVTTVPPVGQHYTATLYAVTDSSSYDADCGFADKAYEKSGTDPYCEKVPSYSSMAVMCGKPPGKCIDTSWNNGIHGVFTYYTTIGTRADGSTYVTSRLKDGEMYYYAKDGAVVSQITYKDDKQIRIK